MCPQRRQRGKSSRWYSECVGLAQGRELSSQDGSENLIFSWQSVTDYPNVVALMWCFWGSGDSCGIESTMTRGSLEDSEALWFAGVC